ncbi:hypothetical protein NDU88_003553 [Pleurodeles waltl]|uniref:Uncharacterized protein n=1 Tax=Pleurodeles waltl TaxID=8319 RepID=A0AAV7RD80_PLEWA|nr:hypothetical protein NDU88_003553 [Pleurodeles waltl]
MTPAVVALYGTALHPQARHPRSALSRQGLNQVRVVRSVPRASVSRQRARSTAFHGLTTAAQGWPLICHSVCTLPVPPVAVVRLPQGYGSRPIFPSCRCVGSAPAAQSVLSSIGLQPERPSGGRDNKPVVFRP